MTSLSKLASVALASLAIASAAWAGPLTGKTIGSSSSFGVAPPSAVVGAGAEFHYSFGALDFDFSEDGLLTASFVRGGGSHSFSGLGHFVEFSDLLGAIDEIAGFTLVSVDNGISGISQGDLSFTPNSVRVDVSNSLWSGINTSATFRIDFVPEPSTVASLAIGLAALAALRRRTRRAEAIC